MGGNGCSVERKKEGVGENIAAFPCPREFLRLERGIPAERIGRAWLTMKGRKEEKKRGKKGE